MRPQLQSRQRKLNRRRTAGAERNNLLPPLLRLPVPIADKQLDRRLIRLLVRARSVTAPC